MKLWAVLTVLGLGLLNAPSSLGQEATIVSTAVPAATQPSVTAGLNCRGCSTESTGSIGSTGNGPYYTELYDSRAGSCYRIDFDAAGRALETESGPGRPCPISTTTIVVILLGFLLLVAIIAIVIIIMLAKQGKLSTVKRQTAPSQSAQVMPQGQPTSQDLPQQGQPTPQAMSQGRPNPQAMP